ncbi:hypothetical protein [Candidatus Tisiphia endosymbiont of Hybos culiciformis]|uniref:hypothetical protein n=1 Tax=Candidatus Tisiphia endosymbiont of Hybos culiciformis TaxID=3139331 RepID=UPI003CCB1C77
MAFKSHRENSLALLREATLVAMKQCKLSFPWTPMSFPRRRESKIPAFAGMT